VGAIQRPGRPYREIVMQRMFVLGALLALTVPVMAQVSNDPPPPATAPASLAELPHWPIGLRLSDELAGERAAKMKNRKADVLVWLPPDAKRIRAMMVLPDNSDSKIFHEHAPLRKVCVRHEVGIVYLRGFFTGIEYHHSKPTETPPAAPDNILKLMDVLVKETGIAEFRHAPWITFGKSSRGEFPFRMGWLYPQRTIAGITYHGESPTWPIPQYAKPQDQTILYVCANGQEEWSGTWYRHVRPYTLNYRQKTPWLPHQVVGVGVGHGNYQDAHGSPGWGKPVPDGAMSVLRIWDYLTLFVDKALTLRLPESGYPTDGPLTLRQIDPATGYLIHPRAVEELLAMKWHAFRQKDGEYQQIPWPDEKHPVIDTIQGMIDPKLLIRRASEVPQEERKSLFWVADRELVTAWLQLHNVKNKDVPIP
jgi:hypothetical protein